MLVRGPEVLLLDDPLRNVDAKLRYEMRLELPRLLRQFQSTVLYVTQDYKEAMALGDRVGVLQGGRFQQVDRPAAIYNDPRTVEIARQFGDPAINLYPCRPAHGDNGAGVEIFGARVALPDRLAAMVDRPCLLGIRPEDVRVELAAGPGTFPVELDAVTPLNVRTALFLRLPFARTTTGGDPGDLLGERGNPFRPWPSPCLRPARCKQGPVVRPGDRRAAAARGMRQRRWPR